MASLNRTENPASPVSDADTPGGVSKDKRQKTVLSNSASVSQLVKTGDDLERNVWSLLGLPVDAVSIDDAVARIDTAIRTKTRLSFVTPNTNWLVRAFKNDTVRNEILAADLSVADGAPLVAMAKMLDIPLRGRVAGSDIFEALRRRPGFDGRAVKVFFFGGRDGSAEKAHQNLSGQNGGGLNSVGWLNPGFGDVESMSSPDIIAAVNEANPDFVVVALGAEKGQRWIEHNLENLTAPVIAHLGAVVDFTGGDIARAPKLMQKLGLEWAWRIKEEPTLWRRYFFDALALINLSLTKLLPQLWRNYRASTTPLGKVEIARSPVDDTGPATIRLSGCIGAAHVGELRELFKSALNAEVRVQFDLEAATSIDSSVAGLILMIQKTAANRSLPVSVIRTNGQIKKILKGYGIDIPQGLEHIAETDGQSSFPRNAVA